MGPPRPAVQVHQGPGSQGHGLRWQWGGGGTPPEAQEPTSEAWLGSKEPAPLRLLIKTQRVSSRPRSSEEGPSDTDRWGVLGSEGPGRLGCSATALQLGTWP